MRIVVALAVLILATESAALDAPIAATVCDLETNPRLYGGRRVRVTGFISRGPDVFMLSDPACRIWSSIWVQYGGRPVPGMGAYQEWTDPLVIEGVAIPLLRNDAFEELDRLLHRPPDVLVHATVTGHFFAGPDKGYGPLYGFHLFTIEEVEDVGKQDRPDLDYRALPDPPPVGASCGETALGASEPLDLIAAQRQAERATEGWRFDDPLRVAGETVRQFGEKGVVLRQTRATQGRFVYEGAAEDPAFLYRVVVSRPYALTFHARRPKRIAWVVIGAYKYLRCTSK